MMPQYDQPAPLGTSPGAPIVVRWRAGEVPSEYPTEPLSDDSRPQSIEVGAQRRPVTQERCTFNPGELVAGRYRVLGLLGRGGMGEVYEAQDRMLDERVALKAVRPRCARSSSGLHHLRREVRLARRVTHENVCRLFDVGLHAQREGRGGAVCFLTMELLLGRTLAERIAAGPIAPAEVVPLLRQMAAGLDAAHRSGVIHCDFKSANVMLVPAPQPASQRRVVITDFGLARRSIGGGEPAPRPEPPRAGTPAYMAPEQVTGGRLTRSTDLYSLGVVLYEMLTGELPFGAPVLSPAAKRVRMEPVPLRCRRPDLDPGWEAVVQRCLQRDPAARYRSAREIAAAVASLASARPGRTTDRGGPSKNGWPASGTLVSDAALLGGVLGG